MISVSSVQEYHTRIPMLDNLEMYEVNLPEYLPIKNDDIDTASHGNNTDLYEVLEAKRKSKILVC